MEHFPVILSRLKTSLTERIRIVEALHEFAGKLQLAAHGDGRDDTDFPEALTKKAYDALYRVGEK